MRLLRRSLKVREIKSATRLRIEPGDTLVLGIDDELDMDEVQEINRQIADALPGIRCLVMSGGLDVRAVLYEGGRKAA